MTAESRGLKGSFLSAIPGTVLIAMLTLGPMGNASAAGDSEAAPPGETSRVEQALDLIWGLPTLYDDPDGRILRKFRIRGRFQVDFPVFDSNLGDYSEAQIRRVRIGFKSSWVADLTLHVEADLDATCEQGETCGDDPYEGLTDVYLGWAPTEAFNLRIGKLSAPFTLDGSTSSTRLLTLERNNVANNIWFPVEYHAGLGVNGAIDAWSYRFGAYSSSTTEEFGSLDGGFFLLFTLGRDLRQHLGGKEALVTLDYVYNEPDVDNVSTRPLEHVASLHTRYDSGTWGFRAELSGGVGYGPQPDLIGLTLMPFYSITPSFQLVGLYTFLHSFGPNGVRFGRYESSITSAQGEEYNEFFAGLNWYVYGHDFKLQTGIKYTMMDELSGTRIDYRGWGWTFAIRMAW